MRKIVLCVGAALVLAGCGTTSTPTASHTASHTTTAAPVTTSAQPKIDPAACFQGSTDISKFLTDFDAWIKPATQGASVGDATQVNSDLTAVENDIAKLTSEATSVGDQARLSQFRAGMGDMQTAINDLTEGDPTDAVSYTNQGEAAVAGFGSGALQICGG